MSKLEYYQRKYKKYKNRYLSLVQQYKQSGAAQSTPTTQETLYKLNKQQLIKQLNRISESIELPTKLIKKHLNDIDPEAFDVYLKETTGSFKIYVFSKTLAADFKFTLEDLIEFDLQTLQEKKKLLELNESTKLKDLYKDKVKTVAYIPKASKKITHTVRREIPVYLRISENKLKNIVSEYGIKDFKNATVGNLKNIYVQKIKKPSLKFSERIAYLKEEFRELIKANSLPKQDSYHAFTFFYVIHIDKSEITNIKSNKHKISIGSGYLFGENDGYIECLQISNTEPTEDIIMTVTKKKPQKTEHEVQIIDNYKIKDSFPVIDGNIKCSSALYPNLVYQPDSDDKHILKIDSTDSSEGADGARSVKVKINKNLRYTGDISGKPNLVIDQLTNKVLQSLNTNGIEFYSVKDSDLCEFSEIMRKSSGLSQTECAGDTSGVAAATPQEGGFDTNQFQKQSNS